MEATLNGDGLRERKWRSTRARIAGSAMAVFTQRGFDRDSVAEIAKAAEVAEKTVYCYFPSKAELFFDQGEDLLTELLHALAPDQRASRHWPRFSASSPACRSGPLTVVRSGPESSSAA